MYRIGGIAEYQDLGVTNVNVFAGFRHVEAGFQTLGAEYNCKLKYSRRHVAVPYARQVLTRTNVEVDVN